MYRRRALLVALGSFCVSAAGIAALGAADLGVTTLGLPGAAIGLGLRRAARRFGDASAESE